jgi:hypothetical protein
MKMAYDVGKNALKKKVAEEKAAVEIAGLRG